MRKFSIVITGECPDEITDEQLAEVASAAEVQVIEPQLDNPNDAWNPLEFTTENVNTIVAVDTLLRTFLDLSTAHLPQQVMKDLLRSSEPTLYEHPDYGFFMHVYGEEEDDPFPDWYPPELITVARYARTLNADYICFDRDGMVDPHLPTWEW